MLSHEVARREVELHGVESLEGVLQRAGASEGRYLLVVLACVGVESLQICCVEDCQS